MVVAAMFWGIIDAGNSTDSHAPPASSGTNSGGPTIMTSVAGWIIAISVSIIALVMTFGLVAAVITMKKLVNKLIAVADPAMKRAEATINTVGGIAETVRFRTDEITHTVEETVEDVSRKVRSTTTVIEDAVTPPLINVASVLAGVSRGLQVWSELSKRGGNSHEQ
jgi:hypothetical protein